MSQEILHSETKPIEDSADIDKKIKEEVEKIVSEEEVFRRRDIEDILEKINDGYIVKLIIERFKTGKRLRTDDIDLDRNSPSFVNKFISLGIKHIYDPNETKKINKVSMKARMFLRSFSFPTYWGQFVPWKALPTVINRLKEIQMEYHKLIFWDIIIGGYETAVENVRKEYSIQYATKKLVETGIELPIIKRKRGDKKEEASKERDKIINEYIDNHRMDIERYIHTIEIPSRDQIRRHCKFEYVISKVVSPKKVQKEMEEAEKIRYERDKIQREAEFTEEEFREKQRVMRMGIEEEERVRRKVVEEFSSTYEGQLRGIIFETCFTILSTINRNKDEITGEVIMPSTTMVSLEKMLDKVSMLDMTNDASIKETISRARGEIARAKNEKDFSKLNTLITEFMDNQRKQLEEIGLMNKYNRLASLKVANAEKQKVKRDLKRQQAIKEVEKEKVVRDIVEAEAEVERPSVEKENVSRPINGKEEKKTN